MFNPTISEGKKRSNARVHIVQDVLFDLSLDKELRPVQQVALDWMTEQVKAGKKYLVTEMPTGSGKSILSQYFIDWYFKTIDSKAKVDIVTNSKLLQSQYVREFHYINNLNGKGSYSCQAHNTTCETGSTINAKREGSCEDCPYLEAKQRFLEGRVGVTNFHVMCLNRMHSPVFKERKSRLLIVDEAHLLEETLNGFSSFSINKKLWDKYIDFTDKSIDVAEYLENFRYIQTVDELVTWVQKVFIRDLAKSKRNLINTKSNTKLLKDADKAKVLDDLEKSLALVLQNYNLDKTNYILDKRSDRDGLVMSLQPLWTRNLLDKYLFQHYTHVILMSGTILSAETFYDTNGIPPAQASFFSTPSIFAADKRPLYYYPVGNMSFSKKLEGWKTMAVAIKKIINDKRFRDTKGIIHAGTYEMMEWLRRDIPDARFIFALPSKRQEALDQHFNSDQPTILVSPSMSEGVDLADEASRFQIIMKVPYPSLHSPVIKQRSVEKPSWYGMKTIQTLLQKYGRSIRNSEDFATTFILDSCFSDVVARYGHMIPAYVKESLIYMK